MGRHKRKQETVSVFIRQVFCFLQSVLHFSSERRQPVKFLQCQDDFREFLLDLPQNHN